MSGSACSRPAEDAVRFHLGEFDAGRRAEFDTHVASCARCAALLRAQQRLDAGIARLPQYRAPKGPPVPAHRHRSARGEAAQRYRAVAAAAVVAAVVLGGLALRAELARREARDVAAVHAARAADAGALFLPGVAHAAGTDALPPWLGFVTCADWIVADSEGVPICALASGGPLGRAGVRAGDVLLAIEDRPVPTDSAMYRALVRRRPGDEVTVAVRAADGAVRRVVVRLEPRRFGANHPFDMEWSPALVASLKRTPPGGVDLGDVFIREPAAGAAPAGVRVAFEPTAEQMRNSVLRPIPYFFGADRVRAGDVIVRFAGQRVTGIGELMTAAMDAQRRDFTIDVLRDGVPVSVPIARSR